MMPKRWTYPRADEAQVNEVAGHTGMPVALAKALTLRGYTSSGDLAAFLNPRLSDMSDPFSLPDMRQAVERIWGAVDSAEKIVIFGDYDVDGVTAVALLTRILRELGANAEPFVPDRLDEGYGLSREAVERCLSVHPATLLITVDCGTNSIDSVAFAQGMGTDVIVTDHHEPDSGTAEPAALVNPKTCATADGSDLTNLSGAGIAFKLAHGLVKTGRAAGRETAQRIDLRTYLDLVALGTVSDLVPLKGENRILVRHGLAVFNRTKWEGLRALKAIAGIRGAVDTYHLGYQLGPRINAAGRIGQPMQAVRLLMTDDASEARLIAARLNTTNAERRRIEQDMAEEAFREIDGYFDPEKQFGLVVARPGWHPGVVGIVASRVSRHYNRPAVILGIDEDGSARGSCRSINEFDVLAGLRSCSSLLTKYGGHRMAAGVELPAEAVKGFEAAFNAAAEAGLSSLELVPVQYIDAELLDCDINSGFFGQLQRLQPFGQDNPEPVWVLSGVELNGVPRVVGGNHLKMVLRSSVGNLDAIAFNYAQENLPEGRLDVAFTLTENEWNGNISLQLQVKDIRASSV